MYRFTSKQYTDKLLRYRLETKDKALVSSALSLVSSFLCLVGARARALQAQKRRNQRQRLDTSFGDDSGSKLRDKEQQRLSSK